MKKDIKFDMKSYIIEWVLLSIGLALLLVFIIYSLISQKDRILQTEENRLITQSKIINENISSKFALIYESFIHIQNMVEKNAFNNLEEISEQLILYSKFFPISRTFAIANKD